MIQMINKLKKNQKGFTLVELIVVLVILAILAAFTIPAMLGFVNDAKAKAYVAEAREVKMAYQSAVTEIATENKAPEGSSIEAAVSGTYTDTTVGTDLKKKVQDKAKNMLLGDITEEKTASDSSTSIVVKEGITYYVTVADGKVSEVGYHKGDYSIVLKGEETITKKEATLSKPTSVIS